MNTYDEWACSYALGVVQCAKKAKMTEHGLVLLTIPGSRKKSFFRAEDSQSSEWFEKYKVFEDGLLWLSKSNDTNMLLRIEDFKMSDWFVTFEVLRDGLWLLTGQHDIKTFFSTNYFETFLWFKDYEKLRNGIFVLTSLNNEINFFNPKTLKSSGWMSLKSYSLKGRCIRLSFEFGLCATLDLDSFKLSP